MINRGNYRRNLFLVKGAAERFGWRVHAYVVMSTHFHLAVELTEPNLSVGMKWLQGTWIRRYNSFGKLVGRPFQGRYKAPLVEPGHALGQVCHYIHLNPVRAGIVSVGRMAEYPWSSLPKFSSRDRPAWLEPAVILGESGELADSAKGWRSYRAYLEFLATDETTKKELVSKRMSRGWCVGSKEFRQEMKKRHTQRGAELDRYAGLAPEEVARERRAAWEEMLQLLAAAAKIGLDSLPEKKSHPDKALLAAAMKRHTSASNAWLAARLQMGQPASASQFARRYLLTKAGFGRVNGLLSRVKA